MTTWGALNRSENRSSPLRRSTSLEKVVRWTHRPNRAVGNCVCKGEADRAYIFQL